MGLEKDPRIVKEGLFLKNIFLTMEIDPSLERESEIYLTDQLVVSE